MNVLLDASLVALCGVFILQATVLRACLGEIATLKRRLQAPVEWADDSYMMIGRRVPAFRAEMLEPAGVLRHRDLRGRANMLLFVDASAVLTLVPGAFEAMAHSVLHKIDGALYVVCSNRSECLRLKDQSVPGDDCWDRTRVLFDRGDRLRNALHVATPWIAIMVDVEGYIAKIGEGTFDFKPLAGDDIARLA